MKISQKVLVAFLLSRTYVFIIALVGSALVDVNTINGIWNVEIPFLNNFARWDSAYFMQIAKNGYINDATWAFRPLFPFLIRIFATPLSPPLYIDAALILAGFVLNNLMFLTALFLVHNLTSKLFSKEIANDSIILLAFYPTAIFYSAIYTESLYLLLTSFSFVFLEKVHLFKSGIFGFLSGLTRPEGILTSIVIALKNILGPKNHERKIKGLLSAFISFTSLIFVMELAWIYKRDYGIIFSVETQWNKVTLFQAFQNPAWVISPDFLSFFTISLPIVVISIAAISSFFVTKKKKILQDKLFPYFFQAALLLILFLTIGGIRSLARFFSTILPIYWVLAIWGRKRSHFKFLILLVFVVQLALGTILFVNWYPFI